MNRDFFPSQIPKLIGFTILLLKWNFHHLICLVSINTLDTNTWVNSNPTLKMKKCELGWSKTSKSLTSSSPQNLRFFEVYPKKTSISPTSIILKIWSSISRMLSSSSPRTLRFFSRILYKPQLFRGHSKTKQTRRGWWVFSQIFMSLRGRPCMTSDDFGPFLTTLSSTM